MNKINIDNKKTASKQNKRAVAVIMVIVAIFTIAIIAFAASRSFGGMTPSSSLVNLPLIETRLMSEDGGSHFFAARIVLEIDSENDIDTEFLHREAQAAINALSHDDIIAFNGTDIVRSAVRERLSRSLSSSELAGIYLTEMVSDHPSMVNRELDRAPRRNPFWEMLRGNR